MVRTMRNHEAAHAIVAMYYGIRFNTISQRSVKFPISAASAPGYKVAIAAGCLGEFYENWLNCNKGNALKRQLGKPTMDCLTPIEKAVSVFCREKYPDDFDNFTKGQPFDSSEYHQSLEEAWPIVERCWQKISRLYDHLKDGSVLQYSDVVVLLNGL